MRQAGFGPDNRLHVEYATTTNPDPLRTAAVLQHMLRAIYIDMEIVQSDIQVHYKKLQTGDFDMAYAALGRRLQRRHQFPRSVAQQLRQQFRLLQQSANSTR